MELIAGFGGGVEKAKIIRAYAYLLVDFFNGSDMTNDREKLKKYGIGDTLAKLLLCSGELIKGEEEQALQRARQALRRMMQS